MKKIISTIIFLLLIQASLAESTFDNLKKSQKTSLLDFILLKIEQRLIQRHGLLGSQPLVMRVQYQSIGTQVDFSNEESKIIISIIGVMDKRRYAKKKYRPKISDCNILRNLLLYGKYGYNFILQKRNKYLTTSHMEEIFMSRFLNNLSLSEEEKIYITHNTLAKVTVVDTVRGQDVSCSGKVIEDLN